MNATKQDETKMEPALLGTEDSRAYLGGISRSALFGLLRSGDLQSIRHGKRRLILRTSLDAWINQRLDGE